MIANDCVTEGVLKNCFVDVSFTRRTNFCDCSNFLGWVGENCNEVSTQLWFARISTITFGIWTAILFLYLLMKIFTFLRNKRTHSSAPPTKNENSSQVFKITCVFRSS